MPFVIEVPILSVVHRPTGLTYARAEIDLTVTTAAGPRSYPFLFDTGCAVTTVDEVVATALGLSAGGTPIAVGGVTGAGPGRQILVRFRFPDETDDSGPSPRTRSGLEVDSTWVVIPAGRKRIALLGFQEVHRHFALQSDPDTLFLCRWADVLPGTQLPS